MTGEFISNLRFNIGDAALMALFWRDNMGTLIGLLRTSVYMDIYGYIFIVNMDKYLWICEKKHMSYIEKKKRQRERNKITVDIRNDEDLWMGSIYQ